MKPIWILGNWRVKEEWVQLTHCRITGRDFFGGEQISRPTKSVNFLINVTIQSDSSFTANQRPCRVQISIQEVRRMWCRLARQQCKVALDPVCCMRLTKLAARERNVQVIAMRNRKRQTIQNSYLRAVPFFLSFFFFKKKKTADMQIDGWTGKTDG